jgi:hypothetical protein
MRDNTNTEGRLVPYYVGRDVNEVSLNSPATREKKVAVQLAVLLEKTGAPDDWKELTRYVRVNRDIVDSFDCTRRFSIPCLWRMGHHVKKMNDRIVWTCWEVLDGRLVHNRVMVFTLQKRLAFSAINYFWQGFWDSDETDGTAAEGVFAEMLEEVTETFWDVKQ